MTELLAPAGDLEKLKIAILYGADAVYLGGRHFGLRAGAGNFEQDELVEGVRFAHARGAKVYVTVNIFAHNQDLELIPDYLGTIVDAGADGVIMSDPGLVEMAGNLYPGLPVHLSTQANMTNWAAARFWARLGVSRIVLARELSLEEIREINKRVQVDLEVFVHGAMCMAYSGRCLISNYLTGRDANRGDCAQSCRWQYTLMEEKRPGEYFPVEEDARGTYIMSSKDLCLIEHIPELIGAGIKSFKIEGRMKSANYVAGVVKAYRAALDAFHKNPQGYRFDPVWLEDIGKVSHRNYTTGFMFGRPGAAAQHYGKGIYQRSHIFAGLVRDYDPGEGLALVEQRNRFAVGDLLEVLAPGDTDFTQKVTKIIDEEGQLVEAAPHPRQLIRIPFDRPVPQYSIIRKIV